MSFDSPVLPWLVLAVFLVALPALLGLSVGLFRLLGVWSGCLSFLLFVVLVLLAALSIPTYLSHSGQPARGEVLDKKEQLIYHLDGSWSREITARVKYRLSETGPAVTDTLSLLPTRFDEMRQGDFVDLRCSEVAALFRFTRLEDQSPGVQLWALATDQPFFALLSLGILIVLGSRLILRAVFQMLFFLTGFVTIAAWWISGAVIPLWQEASIRIQSLDTVSANVREIHDPYLGTDLRARVSNRLFAPYELILLDLTPLGGSERLLSIDVVDKNSAGVKPGDTVNVQYPPGDPRVARVRDSSHTHFWKNAAIITILAFLALAFVIGVTMLLQQQLSVPP
jgi:hypothetical protein